MSGSKNDNLSLQLEWSGPGLSQQPLRPSDSIIRETLQIARIDTHFSIKPERIGLTFYKRDQRQEAEAIIARIIHE